MTTRPVEGGRLVDLEEGLDDDQGPTLKNDTPGGRMQTASPEFSRPQNLGWRLRISRGAKQLKGLAFKPTPLFLADE